MSVHLWERGQSDAEFLHCARALHILSIRKCVKFPKRYTFYVSRDIAETASNVHKFVVRGNSVMPRDKSEAKMRREMFVKAGVECRALVSLIEAANEMFGIPADDMEEWAALIEKEIRLIKGELKSAQKRYAGLPDE